jgi:hypothetical protein
VEPGVFARKWHAEDGEISPPLWIALQAMAEQHLTQTDFAYVAALVVGYGLSLELIPVPMLPSVIEQVRAKVSAFWDLVAAGQLPAPDYGVDGKMLAEVLRDDDGSELDLSTDNELPIIAAELEAAQISKKMAEDALDQCKAKILYRIGNASQAKFSGGMISAKTVKRRPYSVPAGSYRRLQVKFDRAEL